MSEYRIELTRAQTAYICEKFGKHSEAPAPAPKRERKKKETAPKPAPKKEPAPAPKRERKKKAPEPEAEAEPAPKPAPKRGRKKKETATLSEKEKADLAIYKRNKRLEKARERRANKRDEQRAKAEGKTFEQIQVERYYPGSKAKTLEEARKEIIVVPLVPELQPERKQKKTNPVIKTKQKPDTRPRRVKKEIHQKAPEIVAPRASRRPNNL